MSADHRSDWTSHAPKWAAIIALGAASTTAIGWSIGRDGGAWRAPQRATAAPIAAPAPSTVPAALVAPAPAPIAEAAPARPAADPPAAPPLRKLVNINTAAQGELELLPGIGPALAKRILDYRTTKGPFKRIDDLDNVKGIGPKILARLRPQVTVE